MRDVYEGLLANKHVATRSLHMILPCYKQFMSNVIDVCEEKKTPLVNVLQDHMVALKWH